MDIGIRNLRFRNVCSKPGKHWQKRNLGFIRKLNYGRNPNVRWLRQNRGAKAGSECWNVRNYSKIPFKGIYFKGSLALCSCPTGRSVSN